MLFMTQMSRFWIVLIGSKVVLSSLVPILSTPAAWATCMVATSTAAIVAAAAARNLVRVMAMPLPALSLSRSVARQC